MDPSADPALRELVLLVLNTGERIGEIRALRWRDYDESRGLLRLVATKLAARRRKAKERFIPVNAALKNLLAEMRKRDKPGPNDPIIRLSPNNMKRKFDGACRLAGIGHARLYDLRHSALSHLAASGTPLHVLKSIAGHASVRTTEKYMHLLPGQAQRATEALNFGAKGEKAEVLEMADAG